MSITKDYFGKAAVAKDVYLFTLTNKNGLTVKITDYGGIVTSLLVPDKNGKLGDIVLGFDNIESYLAGHPYFGAIIGRYGNRIAAGKFSLNGKEYKLAVNDGENHLHGGLIGFDKVIWNTAEVQDPLGPALELSYFSRDGEEGYPGNLSVNVKYTMDDRNELRIDYMAQTDQVTVVNLTHHSYFNLACSGDILSHSMQINADRYTVVNSSLIPTGEIRPVQNSPMDFIASHTIGSRIAQVQGGYDHNYVLNKVEKELSLAARVQETFSGRTMEVFTTEPGVQFYSGNFLNGSLKGKGGAVYQKHAGFCLETQHFPDSPNHKEFPSTVLKKGEIYKQTTVFKFL